MKIHNRDYTVSLSVEFMRINAVNSDASLNALTLADSDLYATKWLHDNGYKARLEGNVLVVSKPYGSLLAEDRYVVIPNVEYHEFREYRNYRAGVEAAKKFAMLRTMAIIRKINAGL